MQSLQVSINRCYNGQISYIKKNKREKNHMILNFQHALISSVPQGPRCDGK